MLLSEAIEALCIATRANGRSPRTVDSYREKLGHLRDFVGDLPIEEITTNDLRRYIVEQRSRLSPFTVLTRARAMKRLFNWLQEEGEIDHNPAERIKTPTPKRKEPKAISQSDFEALLSTTEKGGLYDLRDRAIMLFLRDTGCRAKGLCTLKVDNLRLKAGLALVTEKRDKTRFAMFLPGTADALREWLEVRPKDEEGYVFLNIRKKTHLKPTGVWQMLDRRAKRAGVEGPTGPHSFRHAFAKDYLLSGGDLASLSEILGHSDVRVTADWYAIFAIRELQEKHRRHSPAARIFDRESEESDPKAS